MSYMEIYCLIWTIVLSISTNVVSAKPGFSAMFVFGDSLADPGNNNYLNSLAKANYLPYGLDFKDGPSGRFTNGKTTIDYLGELLELPLLPAYTNPFNTKKSIRNGINYASAAGGILENTGRQFGERFSFREQVNNFGHTLNQLSEQMSEQELSNYLAKSLAIIAMGSNDYINNYLQPSMYATRFIYTPMNYADLLITRYTVQLMALQSLGLRKFMLGGIGPLGCIPNQLAAGAAPQGKCYSAVNDMVEMFNTKLRSLVNQLNSNITLGSLFVYGNTYRAVYDILNNSSANGLSVKDRACCGIGRNKGQITCLPLSIPCFNRNRYVFWDAFHPTQAVHQLLARGAYSGPPSYCYPVNLQQMADI